MSDADAGESDPLIGCTLDARYRIEARVGAGNVGTVYDASHVELRRRVAIKVLHASSSSSAGFEARFVREARALSRLNHPGCVALLDFGRVASVEPDTDTAALLGMPYLVMEHVAGELLLDRIARGSIATAEAMAIASGALVALRHAHGLQIVHRDLKPGNIILCAVGTPDALVKLVDFGLARDLDAAPAEQTITESGQVFGTPSYLSPEQARGEPPDARSDLYSLGVLLFELLAGRKPFVRDEPLELVSDHLRTPAPPLRSIAPGLSVELDAVLARVLEKEAWRRPASADELLAALRACPEGSRVAEPSIPIAIATGSGARSGARSGAMSGAETATDAVTGAATGAVTGAATDAATDAATGAATDAAAGSVTGATPRLLLSHLRRPRVLAATLAGASLLLALVLLLRRREPALSFAPTEIALQATRSAQRHLALAEAHQRRLWCSDALDELGRALRDAPVLRDDPALVQIAIPCLRTKTQARAVRFLVDQLGATALPTLRQALVTETRPDLREGLTRALAELQPAPALAPRPSAPPRVQ